MNKRKSYPIAKLEKYKWDFLRRNEVYKQVYKAYVAHRKLKKYKKGDEEDIFHLYSTWGIKYPLDPEKTYQQNIRTAPSHIKQVFLPLPFHANTDSSFGDDAQLVLGEFEIDLGFSDRAIISFFKEYLKYYHKRFKNTARKKYQISYKIKKPKFAEYDRYLEIFDLRKKNISWAEIAKKRYFPTDKVELADAKWKVHRDYRRCEKLIRGGYMVS